MSIKLMSRIWDLDEPSGNKLLLLLALADKANDEGYCWPSYDTLAKKTRISRRYTIELIKELVDEGWLKKDDRFKDKDEKEQTSNGYWVMIPVKKPGGVVIPSSLGSDPQFTGVVIPSSPESSLNTSVKQELAPAVFSESSPTGNDKESLPVEQTERPPRTGNRLTDAINGWPPEPKPARLQRTAEEFKDTIRKAIETGAAENAQRIKSGEVSLDHFPTDVQPVLSKFYQYWRIAPPKTKTDGYTDWIKTGRELSEACGEFGLVIIDEVWKDYQAEFDKRGHAYMVARPGGIVAACLAKAGEMRRKAFQTTPEAGIGEIPPEFDPNKIDMSGWEGYEKPKRTQ